MTDDRELLEAAARAAGIALRFLSGATPFSDGPGRVGEWNPLTDDGDALRLAVKLELSIEVHHDLAQPLPWLRIVDLEKHWTHAGPGGAHEEDRAASTRRAIVRAAASLADAATKEASQP